MAASRLPETAQTGPHPRLGDVVARHLQSPWQRPVHGYSEPAFEQAGLALEPGRPIVLDAGCGNAVSTLRLATLFPDCTVLGIDRSAARLERTPPLPDNAHVVRAELGDFWRLAHGAGWRLDRHYLLYPNPWPKPAQLRRRWHAHPVWPHLLALGGKLELRTNFAVYAEEFALALAMAGHRGDVQVLSLLPEQALSPFEAKYARSGHDLYCVRACLG
ncbi:MAG: SAM-dependent methyltransferase [Wenzhouxiangella sp.]|nr:MAG: SAM-dependent methyltransferase [Wenzhouxiangella sp.]